MSEKKNRGRLNPDVSHNSDSVEEGELSTVKDHSRHKKHSRSRDRKHKRDKHRSKDRKRSRLRDHKKSYKKLEHHDSKRRHSRR